MLTKLAFEKKEKFFSENCPINIGEEVVDLLKNGGCYIHGRDKNLRPLLFVNAQKLLDVEASPLTSLAFFIMEYINKYLLVAERIENLNVIFDMTNIGVTSFPFAVFTEVLRSLTTVYHCKVNKIFCLNTSLSFSIYMSTFSLGINAFTFKKI